MGDFMNTLIRVTSTATGTGAADTTVFPFADIGIQFFDWVDFTLIVAATPGGTTPTMDATLQSSMDGVTWVTLGTAFTQVTTSASTQLKKIFRLDPTINWGLYQRLSVAVGSASGNPVYSFSLYGVYGQGPIITTVTT